jgi:serine/threonine protein kinase
MQELFKGPRSHDDARPAGHAADIYACGVLLYRMLFQRYPFKGEDAETMSRNIVSGNVVWPADAADQDLRGFIQSMLAPDWRQRPSIQQVKAHPVFRTNLPTELQVCTLLPSRMHAPSCAAAASLLVAADDMCVRSHRLLVYSVP